MRKSNKDTSGITRRQFAGWLGLVGAGISAPRVGTGQEIIVSDGLAWEDEWVPQSVETTSQDGSPERWNKKFNEAWSWFERQTLIDGDWKLTGITTPWNRLTGERLSESMGYLDERLVPERLRGADHPMVWDSTVSDVVEGDPNSYGRQSSERRMREGRPPSVWLRSMQTEELREWLSNVEIPEAGVSGMTYWVHLTRDHRFHPLLIKGLTLTEQAKLHGAAHAGY